MSQLAAKSMFGFLVVAPPHREPNHWSLSLCKNARGQGYLHALESPRLCPPNSACFVMSQTLLGYPIQAAQLLPASLTVPQLPISVLISITPNSNLEYADLIFTTALPVSLSPLPNKTRCFSGFFSSVLPSTSSHVLDHNPVPWPKLATSIIISGMISV